MNKVQIFQDKRVRTHWDAEREEWYFSVVDVVGALTDSPDPRNYWKVLKHSLKKEGNQSVTNCNQLKMVSSDGKSYKTDVADTKQLLRIIPSIPSPKAEPFKQWLAQVGAERLDEIADPEKAIEGGNVAGSARREIEQRTGQPVVSALNATDKLALDTSIEEVQQIGTKKS